MENLKIGIVGGWGYIGRALTEALLAANILGGRNLTISGRALRPSDLPPQVGYTTDNARLAADADVVVLSVRPEQFASMTFAAPERLVVSVMAAVPAEALAYKMGTRRVVRTIPSAAAVVHQSFTPIWALPGICAAQDMQVVRRLFDTIGRTVSVDSEEHVDYMTGLTGSGPGLVALLAEAMLSHAIARGLSAPLARDAVRSTIAAAGELVGRGDEEPGNIVASLMAYRGTTAAAFEAMISAGFVSATQAGLTAAEARLKTMY